MSGWQGPGGPAADHDLPPALPRELVLASAGSGKTYHISSRLIALLAAGCPPDEIFASTFTRKAAGEILDRVLARLANAAVDDARARELATSVVRENDPDTPAARCGALDRTFWCGVLDRLVRHLHRVNIGTLDAFFVRAAHSFAHELELPPAWTIADDPLRARIRSEALHDVLRAVGPAELVELVRLLDRDAARRSVHETLLALTDDLVAIAHEADPRAGDPWSAFERRVSRSAADAPGPPPGAAEAAALAERIAALPVPANDGGSANAHWARGLNGAAEAVRTRNWEALLGGTLCQRVAAWRYGSETDPPVFSRIAVAEPHLSVLSDALGMARAALAPGLARQAGGSRRLGALVAAACERRHREAGAYGFEDLTRLLGGDDPVGNRPDLWYRLDARTRHILLDEFQDTSLAQWEALRPLLDELMSGHERERAAVIVADPKQCIYGWRGAEPAVVHRLAELYTLERRHFTGSWRSSRVVLDFVNAVFGDISTNEVVAGDRAFAAAAADWSASFRPHEARLELPGHVRLVVGPDDTTGGSVRPNLCRFAASLVARLRRDAPGFTIGVLTRQNRVVARMIHELRELGLHASEEGGNPLTDSAAAATVLALLRLADHPGDAIARYHVATTPLGSALGLTDPDDEPGARRLAHRMREQLLHDGYGATLAALARRIEGGCDARQRRRLHQLVEAGFRHDPRATLRPGDFVRTVEAERVEDPTGADIRVMTVHQSKGLEFDIVVLPELDADIIRGRGGTAAVRRDRESRRVTEAYPYLSSNLRSVFPEVVPAYEEMRQATMRDALSGLYVGITRARHAVHVVLAPDGRNESTATSAARILRCAVAPGERAETRRILHESGDPDWHRALREQTSGRGSAGAAGAAHDGARPAEHARADVRLRPSGRRTRSLPRRTPSELAGADHVDLRFLLRLDTAPNKERGSVAHAWLQEIEWLEDGLPPKDRLRRIAAETGPGLGVEEVEALLAELRAWLATPAIAAVLRRDGSPAGSRVERETPFVFRDGDVVVGGMIDRLVVEPDTGGGFAGATVIDFKTDAVDPGDAAELDRRAEHYRPQMAAYRRAVARRYRLDEGRVATRLVFVRAGAVRDV